MPLRKYNFFLFSFLLSLAKTKMIEKYVQFKFKVPRYSLLDGTVLRLSSFPRCQQFKSCLNTDNSKKIMRLILSFLRL